ncbi:hypothetical protein [Streptomyces sp. NPDC018045]|uniref:hypothetical protein n=1 Tax=Streptomyces sp. NPDC018045 TaxID=3365037 RepID=UPI0037A481E2
MAVINLMVLEGDEQEPEGWTKISKDLNAGAGGQYLYFAFETDSKLAAPNAAFGPITDIIFLSKGDEPPHGYRKLNKDLNAGAGGEYIYAAYTRNAEQGSPINALDVALTDNRDYQPPKPWERYDRDLNAGAGGKYVYLLHI